MKDKLFYLKAEQIKPLAEGYGYCCATDEITVLGKAVGYMYREKNDDRSNSGWCFFSGDESQEYVDDAKNLMFYDVNTIANYDPSIIDFLDKPYGSEYEKINDQWVEIK